MTKNLDSDVTTFTMNLRRIGMWLLILGTIAFIASAVLSIERYMVLVDPNHTPSCSLSLFVDCGPAMGSSQGRIFGFPNPFLGLGAFPVVMVTGAIMASGWEPPRWYWRALTGMTTAGMVMIGFLMYTSMHTLERLCPYCVVVWLMMIPLWWIMIAFSVDRGVFRRGVGTQRISGERTVRADLENGADLEGDEGLAYDVPTNVPPRTLAQKIFVENRSFLILGSYVILAIWIATALWDLIVYELQH